MKKTLFLLILLMHQLFPNQETELKKLTMDQVILNGHMSGFNSDEKRAAGISLFATMCGLVLYTSFINRRIISIQNAVTFMGASYALEAILAYLLSMPIDDYSTNSLSSVFLFSATCHSRLGLLAALTPFMNWEYELKKNNMINYRYFRTKTNV